jgi:hypothetical protein
MYGNTYFTERVASLEAALARKPKTLQIDLIGEDQIPPDWALLFRSILKQRPPGTRLITNARSTLRNSAVLLWLLGDERIIRTDAQIIFRRATVPDEDESGKEWDDDEPKYRDSYSEADPDEADYAKVLNIINEYLPVKEMAGKLIDTPTLRQFGLVENKKLDRLLADAFRGPQAVEAKALATPKPKRVRTKIGTVEPGTLQK